MAEVALCICTCNRPQLLDRLFGLLARIELGELRPLDVALVVVDNRPGGGTRAICDAWRPRLPLSLTLVEEPEPGISFARNRALAAALALDARSVAFIDDDDEPRPDWLLELVRAQRGSAADLVFGIWSHPDGLKPPPLLAQVRFFEPIRLQNRNSYGLPGWAGTFNVLLSRRLIEDMAARGPVFRPEFALTGGGDTDMFIRAHRLGFTHAMAAKSVVHRVWEPDRMTLRGVLRRSFRIGCTRIQIAEAHYPPRHVRKICWRSSRKLAATLAKMPARVVRPGSLVVLMVRAAQYAGELYAGSGRRFVYYGRTVSVDGSAAARRTRPA